MAPYSDETNNSRYPRIPLNDIGNYFGLYIRFLGTLGADIRILWVWEVPCSAWDLKLRRPIPIEESFSPAPPGQ